MATYESYVPTTAIGSAMFNFDAFGWPNYKLSGVVRVSVSDSFNVFDYLSSSFYSGLYSAVSDEVAWTTQMLSNVQEITSIYSQFANINFQWQGDYDTFVSGTDTTPNPADIGFYNLSDINITWTYRSDAGFAGLSGSYSDTLLGYTGGAGDIFLNAYAAKFGGDYTLDLNTRARQTLMHELGHSLGLSHPHTAYNSGNPTLTSDYAATMYLGFDQLGFPINSADDMYKEYFTIMSYDDQLSLLPESNQVFHAHTPMILDVIALQQAYGEGGGTTGMGNDTITAGNAGYRTYFDKGGTDTVDLSIYSDGAYLQMGVTIVGATHLVGVAMSLNDALVTVLAGGDPSHLRWFYGEFENAIGGPYADFLSGNSLSNVISGRFGDDFIYGRIGHDTIDGGDGNDELRGDDGNDIFDWDASQRAGADTMYGGLGNDTYVLGSTIGDQVIEYSAEGIDLVWVDRSFSLLNFPYVENVSMYGTAASTLTGSDDDFGNVIVGNSAANFIDGRAGADTMVGGDGNDIYFVDNAGDLVTEGIGSGIDLVNAAISYSLLTNTENLVLSGVGSINGSGNGENNILSGNFGNNILDGKAGADIVAGGPGNDTYVADSDGDQIMELANSGIDLVESGVSYDLMRAWHVENLTLTGLNEVNGNGNWLDNVINGNNSANVVNGNRGADTIGGAGGSDTLIGGDGNDVLIWDAADGSIQGGGGLDVLRINGSGALLNLVALGDGVIQDVEVIDITGTGGNSLTLSFADVLAISSTSDVLRIDGNAGDTVNRGGGWSVASDQIIGSNTYHTYAQGLAVLLVDSDITVNV